MKLFQHPRQVVEAREMVLTSHQKLDLQEIPGHCITHEALKKNPPVGPGSCAFPWALTNLPVIKLKKQVKSSL